MLTDGGGRRLIRVTDDGDGMTRADLALAVERHATSKLDGDDLLAIRTLGFRGEALPSIGAVARLTITTRHAERAARLGDHRRCRREVGRSSRRRSAQGTTRRGARPVLRHAGAAEVPQDRPQRGGSRARRGAAPGDEPAGRRLHARRRGARAGDLGAALPARPGGWRGSATCSAPDFRANAVAVAAEREGVRVEGFAGLPTLSRANSLGQYLFVNGRPVRDKLLIGAVRGAYADYLPRDRHPVLALFVTLDAARGRRQRASGQDRGALPRRRAGARR